MNVKELKEKLAGMPDDLPVLVGYAIRNNGNYVWHMPVSFVSDSVPVGEMDVASCNLDLVFVDDGDCFLVPELLSDEIVRRARKERERDG